MGTVSRIVVRIPSKALHQNSISTRSVLSACQRRQVFLFQVTDKHQQRKGAAIMDLTPIQKFRLILVRLPKVRAEGLRGSFRAQGKQVDLIDGVWTMTPEPTDEEMDNLAEQLGIELVLDEPLELDEQQRHAHHIPMVAYERQRYQTLLVLLC
jgi:Mg2+ and Co2+ transporter CorA